MKLDAIFEGGGIKGIAFTGAIAALEENGYEFNRVAGASAGALVASLLSVGYTGKELKQILKDTNFNKLLGSKESRIIDIRNIYNLVRYKGIYETSGINQWLKQLFKEKGKEKFKNVSVNGKSKLKIIVSDITKRTIVILPDDIVNYGEDPMEMDIVDAVTMSISIPFFFKPHTLNTSTGKSVLVDGGLLSNFPVWIFDVDRKPRWPTFGFRLLENNRSYSSQGKNNLVQYSLDIISTVLDRNENVYLDDKNRVRTIDLPTLGVKTTNFNISESKAEDLYLSGYDAAKKFISNWDFQEYIKRYRA